MTLTGYGYINSMVFIALLENYIVKDTKTIDVIISIYFTIRTPTFTIMALNFQTAQ